MKRNFGHIQQETETLLQEALLEAHPISRYLACIKISELAVQQIKDMVIESPFATKLDEIHHFKQEAPEIYSQLFYYQELKEIEADRPYLERKDFLALLRRKKGYIADWFRQREMVCRYYSNGATYQDEYLYIRRPTGQWSGDAVGAYIPPDFTIGSFWVSWIKAFERLRNWINRESGEGLPVWDGVPIIPNPRLPWTASKADLILLLCGLYLKRCFNNGQCSLKEVMEWGQKVFDIPIGQFHVALGEMSLRKDPLKFFKIIMELIKEKFDSMTD